MNEQFLAGLILGTLVGLIAGIVASVGLFLLVYITSEPPNPRDMARRR